MDLQKVSYRRADRMRKVADDNSEAASKIFGSLLACTRALSMVAQSFHWRTKGNNYYGDHLLFERIYDDIYGMIDGIAERGIGISGNDLLAEPNLQAHMIMEKVGQHCPEDAKEEDFPQLLLDYTEHHLEMINDYLEKLKEANAWTDGIEDMFQGIASKHEEHAYLLKRRVMENEG